MHIPDNEGKACDAVVRLLEAQTGDARTDIRHPEKDGVGPPVDLRLRLGAQEYAIEHTRIEPFENQIKTGLVFKQINDCIEERLSDTLPGPAYYELHVPTDVRLPEKKEKRNQALNNFVEWIRKNAQYLHQKNSGRSRPTRSLYRSDDRIQGVQINDCIEERLSDTLPGPAYYELHVPTDVRLPEKKEKRNQALNNFVEWIRKNAQYLHQKNSGRSRPTRSLLPV